MQFYKEKKESVHHKSILRTFYENLVAQKTFKKILNHFSIQFMRSGLTNQPVEIVLLYFIENRR